MISPIQFTEEEKTQLIELERKLHGIVDERLQPTDFVRLKDYVTRAMEKGVIQRDRFGLHPVILSLQTAFVVAQEIGMRRDVMLSIMLHDCISPEVATLEQAKADFGEDGVRILESLVRIRELYSKNPTIESENFRDLLLSFAQDLRVILIMIADRLNLLQQIEHTENEEARLRVAEESIFLYAPLAHKLGLYSLKSRLSDLALKYTEPDVYNSIYEKLQATKASREDYIENFIQPIEERLKAAGLKFHIKGRTKAIHSICEKMKRQKQEFENVYDLFAIRIILDTEPLKEKAECWQVYSIVTDMYPPNPNRLRDWLSIPKSNGYESLHITVMGPEGKWVEIQIRTERMNTIAEHGLAAHWRYKGIKDERGFDDWLKTIRDTLENGPDEGDINNSKFKMELYKDDVFIFTPKGDLHRLPKGATVLDFAFSIHSNVGCHCVGARVNGRNVQLKQVLNSGDQVEVSTSTTQTPKQGWLSMVTTSRAKTKIRQALKEVASKQSAIAKETIERKFKNHKLEYDDSLMNQLIRKLGFKQVTTFYQQIAEGVLDVNDVLERYQAMLAQVNEEHDAPLSAQNFAIQTNEKDNSTAGNNDVLVIDRNLKGVEYKFGKCCNPVFGDEVFGFVTVNGGITIHRKNCPNAATLQQRYGYRIVNARWSDKGKGTLYPVMFRVIGNDDIGIVNNITALITKENNVVLRSINIDAHDGLFSGSITLMVDDISRLKQLTKLLQGVKGVKQVKRS